MQSERQKETIAQLELGRTERIEKIFNLWIKSGYPVKQFFNEHPLQWVKEGYPILEPCKFYSSCAGKLGKGDSRREADAHLAQLLASE